MAALPGLSLSTLAPPSHALPATTTTTTTTAPQTAPRTETLPPRSELRFEVPFSRQYSIRLLSGSAEIFGTELASSTTYTFTGTKAGVFTWHGCVLEVQGDAESEYVAAETEAMVEWLNVHGMLEGVREEAGSAPAAGSESSGGPRVLVVGPEHSGKTSLVKCLAAWGVKMGRAPTVVNLDPKEGLLSVPGSLVAATINTLLDVEQGWGTSAIGGPTNNPVKTPLVYHFPFAAPGENADMFAPIVTRMALAVTSRLEEDREAKDSGIVIDTPGSLNQPKGGYESLMHIISEFSVNVVLTMGSERLYNDMLRRFSGSAKNGEEGVHVFRIATSGGAVARDESVMRQVRQHQIKSYFFGDVKAPLNPHGQWWDFSELSIYRAMDASGAESKLSFLPGMDEDEEKATAQHASLGTLEKVTPDQGMVNAILAIKFCAGKAGKDQVRDSCVMGFVYVAEVDETRKKVRFLAPHPSRWGDRALVWGSWPEGVEDLVA